jgi:hypothetical protein
MKTICQLKKKKEEEMDIKNLPMARTMIDIVWAHFGVIQLVSLQRSFYVAGMTVLAKQRRNLVKFNQQTLRFPSHVVHVLHHNLLGWFKYYAGSYSKTIRSNRSYGA